VLIESIGGVAADLILAQAKQWPAISSSWGRTGAAVLPGSPWAAMRTGVRAAMVPVMLVRGVAQQGKVTPR